MKTALRWAKYLGIGSFALTSVAQAHPGHDGHDIIWDFHTGFAHPFSGWDHVFAMIAVGWWAAQLGGRARWLVPVAFLGLLLSGTIGGFAAMRPAGLEQGIAASVLVLGLLIATATRLPMTAAAAVVSAFAVFHGLAHGAEAPANVGAVTYVLGFLSASAVLNALGLICGSVTLVWGQVTQRAAGLACAVFGAMLLLR